jgi:hypothetical protein
MKENARIVLNLICELGNVAGKVLEDGKVTVSDAGALLSLTDDVMALKNINLSSLFADLKAAMSPEEFGATLAEVAAKFDIPQDEIEAKIEKSLVGIGMIAGGLGALAGAWLKK